MGEDFRLKWNDHHSVFFSTAESLCHGDHLTDVTLSCGSREFSAHKLVLSICSSYFSQLFAPKPGAKKRPADSAAIVYLKDVDGRHMELLLNYMYRGEINVEESELMGLLATAKGLQIKGLTENDDSETPKEEPRGTPVRSVSRGGASTSNSGVKRPQPSSKNTHIPAPKKIKEESASSSNLHLEAANVSGAAGDHSAEVHEESDYQNAEYLDDTEDIADYSMEDNPGESMVYEGDPNNPGIFVDPLSRLVDQFEDVSHEMKSPVWRHFYRSKAKTHGRCNYCSAIIRTLGGTTTAMMVHLRTKHGADMGMTSSSSAHYKSSEGSHF